MNNLIKPAIVIVGYNRPDSISRLLDSIGKANYKYNDITLIISIDKSNKVNEIINIAKEFDWVYGDKKIRTFETRQGLREHILQCGDLSIEHDAVIILEDDIVVSPEYYNYTVSALNYFEDCESITGIALYSHQWNGYGSRFFNPIQGSLDVYFAQFGVSWGQCWSSKHWIEFRTWYEKNKGQLHYSEKIPHQITEWPDTSWGKYFNYYMVENNKYYVMPYVALSTNFTDIGQHAKVRDNSYQVPLLIEEKEYNFGSFEQGMKYDIFFEPKFLEEYFSDEINSEGICVDLYSTKKSFGDNRYLLSTSMRDYKIVKTFGLLMRPHEMNIIYNIPGNDIFLYDLKYSTKVNEKKKNNLYQIYKFELRAFNWRQILPYALFSMIEGLKYKVRKSVNRIFNIV